MQLERRALQGHGGALGLIEQAERVVDVAQKQERDGPHRDRPRPQLAAVRLAQVRLDGLHLGHGLLEGPHAESQIGQVGRRVEHELVEAFLARQLTVLKQTGPGRLELAERHVGLGQEAVGHDHALAIAHGLAAADGLGQVLHAHGHLLGGAKGAAATGRQVGRAQQGLVVRGSGEGQGLVGQGAAGVVGALVEVTVRLGDELIGWIGAGEGHAVVAVVRKAHGQRVAPV
ncbi:hypothetical protein D3C72_614110 [compost metagenome]